MSDPIYRRVIVKLSGEALAGAQGSPIDQAMVERIASDLVGAAKLGVELGVVVGGGNIFAVSRCPSAACHGQSATRWACWRRS
jgi:uridylate kinase